MGGGFHTGIAQLAEHWSPKPGVGSSSLSSRAKCKNYIMFGKVVQYCKESYDELVHKVTWPTNKELTSQAILVLVASIIIALLVFVVDTAFEELMKLVYSLFN